MAAHDSKNIQEAQDAEAQEWQERQPLLAKARSKTTELFGSVDTAAHPKVAQESHEWDSSNYNIAAVNSWKILFIITGSAFDNISILKCMLFSLCNSFCVAFLVFFWKQAVFIKAEKLFALGTFLGVFVGMLLGFFVSSSMSRWYGCVHGFMELLEAVRCLQMQMFALGVDAEHIDMLNRYGLLSVWLVHLSLNSELRKNPRKEAMTLTDDEQREQLWNSLEQARPDLVLPEEKKMLYPYKDCYALLWTWVASLIGRMAQDGEIPPMASPTYGRIVNIVEWAYGSIRDVRMMHRIKAPFIYVNTLAALVHFNTILNSISFGLILGVTVQVAAGKTENMENRMPHMVASLFMQFCISMVAPFMYLCLLEVCVCISQPFTFMDTKIPSHPLVLGLEEDLANARIMAENTKWEKPHFKK